MKKQHLLAFMAILTLLLASCGQASTGGAAPTSLPATTAPTTAPTTAATTAPTSAPTTAATTAPTTAATSAPTTAPSGQVVDLQFWHGQSQSQEAALTKLIDDFNSSHPNIHVTATYQGTYSDLYKKVTAAIAAGSPPDLAIAYQNDVSNYVKDGAVIPLDSLMTDPQIGFTSQDMKDIFPAFIDHYPQFDNKVYSIAFMRSMDVMYYNMDMLKAAGFDSPPKTWDEFLNVCKAVSNAPTTYCYELTPDASTFSNWLWSRGGTLLAPDEKTVTFNDQIGVQTMDFLGTLFTNNYATIIAKSFQDQTDFSLGKIAFTFGSTAGLPYYKQAISQAGVVKNWGIQYFPHTTPNPVVDVYGPSVTIFKTTTEKERAAFVFLKWLMGTKQNAQWCEATYYFPARASTKAEMASFISDNPRYGDAYGWLQYGMTEPTLAAWNPVRTYIADAETAVANNTESPKAALDKAAQQANSALSGGSGG